MEDLVRHLGGWNPTVSTMKWQGPFASGTTGVLNTGAGQCHKMKLLERFRSPAR